MHRLFDGRQRLTSAVRNNKSSPTITATYTYTYNAGDNLLTKVEPFLDDFNDGNYTGWTVGSGTWDASAGVLTKTSTSGNIYRSQTDGDTDVWLAYACNDTSNSNFYAMAAVRYVNWDNQIYVMVKPGRMDLIQRNGGTQSTLASAASTGSTQDVWYDLWVQSDGASVTVWRKQRDTSDQWSQVLSTSSAAMTSSSTFFLAVGTSCRFTFDDIRIVSDALSSTTAYTYDAANELTRTVGGGLTTDLTYDDWGRMVSKYVSGSYSATYAYRYGDKLYSVTSNFPNEGTVTYQYGGDQKRRERTASGGATKYKWDVGWNVINEESAGALTRTMVIDRPLAEVAAALADVSGTDPSTGTYRYYCPDNLRSTRRLRAQDKSSLGQYEYTPYGMIHNQSGVSLDALAGAFTGKKWDAIAQLYYFPYRYYSPTLARWLTRDPRGVSEGPNAYLYVRGRPTRFVDAEGAGIGGWIKKIFTPAACCKAIRDSTKAGSICDDELDQLGLEAFYEKYKCEGLSSLSACKLKCVNTVDPGVMDRLGKYCMSLVVWILT